MSEIKISLFASAARPQWWLRLWKSLQGNKIPFEIVFVGPSKPKFEIPLNFRFYECSYKPTQCYAAASHFCNGELIGYMADDAVYDSNSIDKIWNAYLLNGKKTILTQTTIENDIDVSHEHYFFRHCPTTPMMAPMAFLNREWFWKLGGYDRNFVSGQAENDIVMRAYQDGGKVELVKESLVYLNHEQVHGGFLNKVKYRLGKNSFRTGYSNDRRYLEECWVKIGYGTYNENSLDHSAVSSTRLLPHQPFNYENILTVSQGPSGRWSKE